MYKKNNKFKKIKPDYNSNKVNHQRFNSHNKFNMLDINKMKKLTISLPKSEKSSIKKDIKFNLKNKQLNIKNNKNNINNIKILKYKTTVNKKIKKSSCLEKKKKKKSKYDFKNIYNLNKHSKTNYKANNKTKTKSEFIFKDLTKNYFENLCNLRLKTTNLSAILNNNIFILNNKYENQKIDFINFFDDMIDNFKNYKQKVWINLDNIFNCNKSNINDMISKLDKDKDLIENLLDEYKNNKILDNNSLIKILNSFNIKSKKNNNKFILHDFPKFNFEDFKKSLKNISKPKKIKGVLEYNKSIEDIKISVSNYFTKFNDMNKSKKRKKGCSHSMAFGDFFISNNRFTKKKDNLKYKIKEKTDEDFNVLSSLNNSVNKAKLNCSSISLKCSEELENPIKDII